MSRADLWAILGKIMVNFWKIQISNKLINAKCDTVLTKSGCYENIKNNNKSIKWENRTKQSGC